MAYGVLNQCVTRSRMGGFVTLGIRDTIDYLVDPVTDFDRDYRKAMVTF